MPNERRKPGDPLAGPSSGEGRSGAQSASAPGERREPARRGTVTSFDDYVGLGVVTGDDGVDFPFHCVEIADGSRTIEVGADVTFVPTPKLGRIEAFDLRISDACA